MPRAKGAVPVGHPVDADGAATCIVSRMIGTAGRGGPNRTIWRDGQDFPLVTEGGHLMILIEPMDLTIASTSHRLAARENYYVALRGGKIVDFEGRQRPR